MSRGAEAPVRLISIFLVVLGAAILVRTIFEPGPQGLRVGYLVGPALVAAGAARLWLASGTRGGGEG